MRRAQLLDRKAADIAAAVSHLGYVQIDPTNVCGRMHDLILRVRVENYREGDLMRHVHGDGTLPAEARVAFEHHLPSTEILVAFALDAWPHLLAFMRRRSGEASWWSGRLSKAERELSVRLLDEIGRRGPLSSEDIGDRRAGRTYWGRGTMAKVTLQKLYSHGRLLIAGRSQGRRKYDLPERVLPARVLAMPEAAPEETTRWLAVTALRQRRLVLLKRAELAAVEDLVQPVQLPGAPLLHCLRTDLPELEAATANPTEPAPAPAKPSEPGPTAAKRTKASPVPSKQSESGPVPAERSEPGPVPAKRSEAGSLLAPLDPLIYDRKVTRAVWDFDYVWEAYMPAAKRQRGHFAMPLLCGLEIAGHVDPKADRAAGRLGVVSRRVRRGFRAGPAVKELASFLGLRT